jgi:hypothetical protein
MEEYLEKSVAKTGQTSYRMLGDEAIAVNFQNAFFYHLDEVGSFIWNLCDGRHTVRQISDALVEEYEVEPGEAARDCLEFIQELVDQGLLEWNRD